MAIRLSFGTAGIRAALGPGDDELNVHAVRGIAHALCTHLAAHDPAAPGRGLCVGFDGRRESDVFAREVVRVARAHGFRVRAFEHVVPTPLLAFVTRFYGAAAGAMITASHNPPHENGVKLYLEGGAQVTTPHDREIAQRLAAFDEAQLPAGEHGAYEALGETEIEAYLAAVGRLVEPPSSLPLPRFAYSALCGVGSAVTRRLLLRAGAHDVVEVPEQADPRPDFGGLTSPNPEHESALAKLLALTEAEKLDLAFAHDPDADRLAVVTRDGEGRLRLLRGDEVGALLGAFVLAQHDDPSRALLVSTLVSGELLERIARAHGARFERTPTGFKWIASRARALERTDALRFVFGYEEAIGYAFGTMADDKDGVAALYVMLEIVRRLHAQGRTLWDALGALFAEHGLFESRQLTVPRAGAAGAPDLMARLRQVDPEALLGAGATCVDYARAPEPIELLVFRSADGARLCVRPSGTEPKVKLYLHAHAPVGGAARTRDEALAAARQQAQAMLDALEARVRAL